MPDGNEILQLDDMNITVGQICEARTGHTYSQKWPKGKIVYTFDPSSNEQEPYDIRLSQAEQNIVKKVAKRFNKDLNGCASIR